MSGIVDPRPWVERRLKEIERDFGPQLQAAQLAAQEADTRPDRKAARTTLKSLEQQHRRLRREAQRPLRIPVTWFKPPTR